MSQRKGKQFKYTSSRRFRLSVIIRFILAKIRSPSFLFTLPALAVISIIIIYPLAYTFWMSLNEWYGSGLSRPQFIGLANYGRILLRDYRFHEAFFRSFYFTLLAVSGETVLGVGMALLFNQKFWGRGILRTLAILPMIAAPTAIALIFVMIYHPTLGVANYLLGLIGIGPSLWTYSKKTALYALVLIDIWQWTPLIMLISLAGLADIPQEHYEAATLDGASFLQSFWFITLPLLRPAILVAIIFRSIDAIKTFELIYVMTQGGPGTATETLYLLLFNQAFAYFDMGYASTVAVAIFVVVLGISVLLLRVRRGARW